MDPHDEIIRLREDLVDVVVACLKEGVISNVVRSIACNALKKSSKRYGDHGLEELIEEGMLCVLRSTLD